MLAEIDQLKGIQPGFPPRPPDGQGLPRYGLRWNGPQQPLTTPMDDGYWTPWHLADQIKVESERLSESDKEATELCDTLSALLGQVAVAVRGPEEPKTRHGFHDLPSRVKTVVTERDQLKAKLAELEARVNLKDVGIDRRDALIREVLDAFKLEPDGSCINPGRDFIRPFAQKAAALLGVKKTGD